MNRHDAWKASIGENAALLEATGLPSALTSSEARFREFLVRGETPDHATKLDQLAAPAFEALQTFVLYRFPFDMDVIAFDAFEARRIRAR